MHLLVVRFSSMGDVALTVPVLRGILKHNPELDYAVLKNNSITINDTFPGNSNHYVNICFAYKFSAEIGALGDNVLFLRSQIKNDLMLQLLTNPTDHNGSNG